MNKAIMSHVGRLITNVSALLAVAAILFVSHINAPKALANEGRIDVQNGSVSCEGLSVWESDRYHIVGRCQGLVYPYAERLDRYMIWVQPSAGGNPVRLEEVERGLFDAQTDVRFDRMIITAEEDSAPRTPGTTTVVSADIVRFEFSGSPAAAVVVSPNQPTPTPIPSVTPAAARRIQGINFGSNAIVNVGLIVVLSAVVLWILFFLRR